MAFVGTGPASDTNIHEDFYGAKPIEPFPETFGNNLFPVFGKVPVFIYGIPLPCKRETDIFKAFGVSSIRIDPLLNINGGIHPSRAGRSIIYV